VRGAPQGAAFARRSLLVVVAGTVAVFALLAQLGENGIVAWWRLRAREAEVSREVAELVRENADLEARLEALKNDPEALERLAREEYGMRRADEEVLAVLPAESETRVP